jgi:hypothetical protein
MNAAVKLDENLGRTHVDILRTAGYEVDRVHDQGLSGAADATVWERVIAERSLDDPRGCLAVADESFTRIRRVPPQ